MQRTATLHSKLHRNVTSDRAIMFLFSHYFSTSNVAPWHGLWRGRDGSHPRFALVGEICSPTSNTCEELFLWTLSCSWITARWCTRKKNYAHSNLSQRLPTATDAGSPFLPEKLPGTSGSVSVAHGWIHGWKIIKLAINKLEVFTITNFVYVHCC